MLVEAIRLALGLAIALFHRPVADFMLQHERALVIAARQRGFPLPPTPTTETTRNIYFCLGIFLALFEILRIWTLLHPLSSIAGVLF
ncbi:MAG TPA: hypothetical protein VFU76_00070 [Terriglobales bacterium]|nr:hypothetical protein [Terriglobales bacterium]